MVRRCSSSSLQQQTRLPPAVVLLLLVASAPGLCGVASACTITGVSVTRASSAPQPDAAAYSLMDVDSHFKNLVDQGFASNTKTTFACVDARTDHANLATPG
jgi:hypothetical protein